MSALDAKIPLWIAREATRGLLWVLALSFTLAMPGAAQESKAPSSGESSAGEQSSDASDQATFQVVIHAENPTVELPASTVSRMFLKKLKRWPHGVRVVPIDLQAKSDVRKDFTRAVHKKSVTAIKSFWQRMIFSGRGDPPPLEESSEEAVLDFVRSNPGAIGYVAAATPLGDGVKKLKVTL